MGKDESINYAEVEFISPFAVGVPGKRTFFLGLGEKDKWVRVWLEKEDLQALAVAIESLLNIATKKKSVIPLGSEGFSPSDVPGVLPYAELDVIEMALGLEKGKGKLELLVQRTGSQEPAPLTVHCLLTLSQLRKLAGEATRVCAAGRPLCRLCGGPIDATGHVCPKQN